MRMRRELLLLLEEMSAAALVVLVLEDLHWSDDATVDLINAVAARVQSARLLLLCSFRTVEAVAQEHPILAARTELVRKRDAHEIALSELDAGAVLTYLRRRFGADLDERMGEIVRARSDGNPFAMVATADHLESAGRVVPTPGGWILAPAEADEIHLPDSLRAVAEQQLARLEPADVELLEAASVGGPDFASQIVAAALECALAEVEERCMRLARQGRFLRDDGVASWRDGSVGSAFAFTHVAYRDALYQRLPAARRALLHRRIGARLLAGCAQEAEAAARLALHFERGGEFERALEFHRRAAEAAASRFAPREAAVSLVRALDSLARVEPTADTAHTELLLRNALGQALQAIHGSEAPEVGDAFARARVLAEQLAATDEVPGVLVGLFGVHLSRGELHAALELSEQLLVVGRRGRRVALRYAGHLGNGIARTHLGDLGSAGRHLHKAVALFPQAMGLSPVHPGVPALCYAARVAFHLGRVEQARRYVQQARALARETANPLDLAWTMQLSGVVAIYLREWEATLEAASALIDVAEKNGLEMFGRVGRLYRGWARAWLHGDPTAVAEMRRVFTWDGLGQHGAAFLLADAGAHVGGIGTALEVIERALELDVEECLDRPDLLRLRGDLLLANAQRGGAEQPDAEGIAAAEESLAAAIDGCRAMGSRMFELRAATSLARLCVVRGQRRRARRSIEELYLSFPSSAECDDLRRARELLETLGGGRRPAGTAPR
jgi:tetratricopeptide (TPR) repeat protein